MSIEMLKGDYENSKAMLPLPRVRSPVCLQQSVSFSFSEETQRLYQRVSTGSCYAILFRLRFNPPAGCKPKDLEAFLVIRGIAFDGILVEVFLHKLQPFIILDACQACMIE